MDSPLALTIRQFSRATFRALHSDHFALIRVRSGDKRVSTDLGAVEIAAGELAVMAPRLDMTIENRPAAAAPYVADLLVIPESLTRSLRGEIGSDGDPMRKTSRRAALAAFDRALEFVADPAMSAALKSHAVREVLLWLGEEGIGFGRPRPPSLADRLRALVEAEPARDWRAGAAAKALAVSEPTLRRHLAAEGKSFTGLVADVRMSLALALLQSGTLPINRIALEVGYDCASRFSMRFRKRFGLSPSAIRSRRRDPAVLPAPPSMTARAIDRFGIASDRPGS